MFIDNPFLIDAVVDIALAGRSSFSDLTEDDLFLIASIMKTQESGYEEPEIAFENKTQRQKNELINSYIEDIEGIYKIYASSWIDSFLEQHIRDLHLSSEVDSSIFNRGE